jgi:pimeloyl-ACP methyl ester carboxylesterase
MATPQQQRVPVNGTELAYEVRGAGEPVVFIHGGIVADAFAPLLTEPALAGRYQLISYHRRGYGDSARPAAPVGLAEQAADCRALLAHLGVARAHVVGYSFGGAIALQLALDAPALVHSLALLEPTIPAALADPAVAQYFLDALGAAMARYQAGDAAGAVDAFARGAFGAAYPAALEAAAPGAVEQAIRDADAMFRVDLPALQAWSFTPAEAGRIAQPILSVYHQDPVWPGFEASHTLLAAWLPQTEAAALPLATHLLQLVDPQGAAAAVAGFLTTPSRSAPDRPPNSAEVLP